MGKLRELSRNFNSNLRSQKELVSAKRNLILSILKSTTTKREARNYLKRYKNQLNLQNFQSSQSFREPCAYSDKIVRATRGLSTIKDSSSGKNKEERSQFLEKCRKLKNRHSSRQLGIAVFLIKTPAIIDEQWEGITETFKRLLLLGISPIIVLDYDHSFGNAYRNNKAYMTNQTNKIMNSLEKYTGETGLKTTNLGSIFELQKSQNELQVFDVDLILVPLLQGIIPIVQPIVYDSKSSSQSFAQASNILYYLCLDLLKRDDFLSIEKVVIVDPVGGIPSLERKKTSHVLINLCQEYSDIVSELHMESLESNRSSHLRNLNTMNDVLGLISRVTGEDTCTGIISTPSVMAANNDELNPIVYNVLTDRAIISSSLPLSHQKTPELSTSVLKKGISVKTITARNHEGNISFNELVKEGLIDKQKLFNVMNDSFGKTLDVENYFDRLQRSLATVIIIGDYDGAAIITFESNLKSDRKVAYLDKFAIAKRNQGLPGFADILFKLILQAHQEELIWRSRKSNPVNKWYFDRSCGTLSLKNSPWRLFYTGDIFNKKINKLDYFASKDGIDIDELLKSYADIISSIPPSFL